MMYSLIPVILLAIYAGNVLGCLVLCESIPELKKAKKLVWYIPILNFSYAWYVLFSRNQENRFEILYWYIRTPCKNAVVAYATIEARKKAATQKKRSNNGEFSKKGVRHFFRDSIEDYGRAISGGS